MVYYMVWWYILVHKVYCMVYYMVWWYILDHMNNIYNILAYHLNAFFYNALFCMVTQFLYNLNTFLVSDIELCYTYIHTHLHEYRENYYMLDFQMRHLNRKVNSLFWFLHILASLVHMMVDMVLHYMALIHMVLECMVLVHQMVYKTDMLTILFHILLFQQRNPFQ